MVKLLEIYESHQSVHLVLELVSGGELYAFIKKRGMTFEEAEAQQIMRGLL